MKAILVTILGVALISSIGISTSLYLSKQQESLQANTLSSYIAFVNETLVDNLQLSLMGQSDFDQLQMIKSLMLSERKFFNANQILKILTILKEKTYPERDSIRNYAIQTLKPYIAPLSSDEALQILKLIDPYDGIASGIIISQIYDLNGNAAQLQNLMWTMEGYGNLNRNQIIQPQSTKVFRNNFLITSEGKHVGFLINQSTSMNSIAYTKADGTKVTRYDLLKNFYDNRFDTFQSYSAFSYILIGNYTEYSCQSCSTGSYEQGKALNSLVYNIPRCDGVNNFYSRLSQLLSNPIDQLSDIFIWSDGIITEGTKDINEFVKLIDETNKQRRIQIRINTVSFQLGGQESQQEKDDAIKLMQTLADVTGGTFIQINQPQ